MSERVTDTQKAALRLTHRGRDTLIIRRSELIYQPTDIANAIAELEGLVTRGFVTKEDLDDDTTRYTILPAGRDAIGEE